MKIREIIKILCNSQKSLVVDSEIIELLDRELTVENIEEIVKIISFKLIEIEKGRNT